jgi:hypothetical protein
MYLQDIHNQRFVNSLEIEGLSSVLSCLVEYKGQSVIVQSIIPGVLQTVIYCLTVDLVDYLR